MRAKREGLTGINIGINKSTKQSEAKRMVGGRGLEPLTSAMSTQRSNQLS